MIRAIVWKEFREQGLIAITLVLLGAGFLEATAILAVPPEESASPNEIIRFLGAGRLATLALAVTAGMVCGSAIFAAEREGGTIAFLESLPSSHRQLWRAKLVAGIVLTIVQVSLILATATAFGLVSTWGWALAVLLYSLLAFVWGMFGSTTARTSLGSVGIALPACSLTAMLIYIPVALFFQAPGSPIPRGSGGILFLLGMFATPLLLSSWLFSRSDRSREVVVTKQSRSGFHALYWLTFRQLLFPSLVLSPAALLLGLGLLVPGFHSLLVWPALALGAGALAGATVFADEQIHGSARYWAEQRLPLGRTWVVKIAIHILFMLWLLLLLSTPLVVHSQISRLNNVTSNFGISTLSSIFGTPLFDELGRQGWKFLLAPAVYGFAAGQLCGLIFRKLVVTFGVATVLGGMGFTLLGPSILAGGVKHWQLWLPPAIALLTGRLLISAWSADRLSTRKPLATLIGGIVVSILATAVGIGYRVLEIPDSTDSENDIRYMAQLPPLEDNTAGRDFNTAAKQYSQTISKLSAEYDRNPLFSNSLQSSMKIKLTDQVFTGLRTAKVPEKVVEKLVPLRDQDMPRAELSEFLKRTLDEDELNQFRDAILNQVSSGRRLRPEEKIERVPYLGWPANDPTLEAWLDRVFSVKSAAGEDPSWYTLVESALLRPVGIFEHPQKIGTFGVAKNLVEYTRQMSVAMLARGLQLQAHGDSAAFISQFQAVLYLVQSMRNGSAVACLEMGNTIERVALLALDRWIEYLAQQQIVWLRTATAPIPPPLDPALAAQFEAASAVSQAHLLKPAIALLESFDTTEPFDSSRQYFVERHIIREALKAPGDWLPQLLALPPDNMGGTDPIVDLVSLAWTVPWEKERTRRLVGLGYETHPPNDDKLLRGRPGMSLFIRNRTPADLAESDRQICTNRRAGILKLALRAYRIERGKFPDSLNELITAGYLHRALPDPYDTNRGFGYRISEGEKLKQPARTQSERIMISQDPAEWEVPPGQAIIWSVGPDRTDQGGVNPPGPIVVINGREYDVVYLVPLGPVR
ncbi:MAG TPA: ABC transporter permease [Gemmata sp.]|nr:ABC transporter permease [Gemmata sp.]